MAIIKKSYEISVWDEKLGENGQKTEIKRAVIGADDMTYLGRATSPKFTKNLNGTHTLNFQLPSKFFDSEKGEYVHNEFCDYLFNERKVKLKHDGEWYEFYVKNITENKQFKSIMYQYTCEDAFIDELSRNGYGIIFDTELYNNVEEIGTFTETILEDSVWEYDASKNWGDFTEYSEEKLFKIPIKMFGGKISGYKLNYQLKTYESKEENNKLKNVFTGEERFVEMGDDIAREQKQFWDNGSFDKGIELLSANNYIEDIPNDEYIYVPYSCLDFCYAKDSDNPEATEEIQSGTIENIKSYLIAPPTIDPNYLIQFLAIPKNAEVLIDEAGLIVNKDYHYVLPLKEWVKLLSNQKFPYYDPMEHKMVDKENIRGVPAIVYEGYLEKINDVEVNFGKKISITDRTEINISEEIDQYVTVYNNKTVDAPFIEGEDWIDNENINYRICSYDDTRIIVPQLARNYIQNGTNITDTSGWEVMKVPTGVRDIPSTITVKVPKDNKNTIAEETGLIFNTKYEIYEDDGSKNDKKYGPDYTSLINFGIIGQEKTIQKGKIYAFYINYEDADKHKLKIIIGEGGIDATGSYKYVSNKGEYISFNVPNDNFPNAGYVLIKSNININNPFFIIQCNKGEEITFKEIKFFEAYSKGRDFFPEGHYKYSGRELFDKNFTEEKEIIEKSDETKEQVVTFSHLTVNANHILLEEDVFSGDAYTYKRYFKQQIQYNNECEDTFMMKSLFDDENRKATDYSEDDFKIVTSYIDLSKCKYYNTGAVEDDRDCSFGNSAIANFNKECLYQKYGYCPYLFETQKHCRKIRTLNGEKSNRFNLTQELSKVFEVYPVYYSEHLENGKIITDKIKEIDDNNKEKFYDKMRKKVFYITEKGKENKLGFRYEKNLSNISRTFDSKEIVTKLYVEDVDSELSPTGLCSIKTAPDNPSKDSYIIDFSYYILKGLLDKQSTENDLYGNGDKNNISGFLKQMGFYNGKYDELSNKIINLQDESYTELAANLEVNLNGIDVALKELRKINSSLSKYDSKNKKSNDSYKALEEKLAEQNNILNGLLQDTFNEQGSESKIVKAINKSGFKHFKEKQIDTFEYTCSKGIYAQYKSEYLQIQEWKKERAKYLEKINKLSQAFFKKYEPYLKEGTWSDSNYLSDNSYYFGAKEVAKQGAIPKLTYNITVVDLDTLDKDYNFDIADSSYIEDIETFGINKKTGLPNRLKVLISGITYDLDIPTQNTLQIQNYTTQFEDLFQQVSASVQSLSFNENIYKRSSNFTSTQNISEESLQGGLSENQLTLLETDEKNIELDYTGQSGSDINNHANKYKLSGEGLFFSNNGGQSWNVGVTPKGINADYIKVGSLDASKISIVDGNYLYFLWDKGGITAYRTPGATAVQVKYDKDDKGNFIFDKNTNTYIKITDEQAIEEGTQRYSETKYSEYFQDFARFNKYGLSLAEDNQIKLRAGYEYVYNNSDDTDLKNKGQVDKEKELLPETKIGFYLYNDNGNIIFKAENAKNAYQSAQIALRGEIYTTDTIDYNESKYENLLYQYKNLRAFNKIPMFKIVKEELLTSSSSITDKIDKNTFIKKIIALSYKNNKDIMSSLGYITYRGYKVKYEITINKNISYIDAYEEKNSTTKYYRLNQTGFSLKTSIELKEGQTESDLDLEIQEKNDKEDGFSKNLYENAYMNENVILTFSATNDQQITYYTIQSSSKTMNIYSKIKEDEIFNSATSFPKKNVISIVSYPQLGKTDYKYKKLEYVDKINIKQLELYHDKENNLYYTEQKDYNKEEGPTKQTNEGTTELYINNKVLLDDKLRKASSVSDHRLFSCVKRAANGNQNIFTIKKDGSLYFGGKIQDEDDANFKGVKEEGDNTLGPCVTIENEGIRITADGTLAMDLTLFEDIKTGEKLMDIIANAVNSVGVTSHSHKIDKLNFENNQSWLYGPNSKDEFDYLGVLETVSKTNPKMVLTNLIRLFRGEKATVTPQGAQTSPSKTWTGRLITGKNENDLITVNCKNTTTSTYSSGSEWSYGNTGTTTSYKDWYWSGDSRTVGLRAATGAGGEGFGSIGKPSDVKEKDVIAELKGLTNKNIVLWWGVNGLDFDGIVKDYNDIATNTSCKIIVLSVGKVFNTSNDPDNQRTLGNEGGGGSTKISDYNSSIQSFNNKLKQTGTLSSNIIFLDITEFLQDMENKYNSLKLSAGENNGLHYSNFLYEEIKNWVEKQIPVVEVDYSIRTGGDKNNDIFTLYNMLLSVGYNKTSAIGILGNCQAESGFCSYIYEGSTYMTEKEEEYYRKNREAFYSTSGGFGLFQLSVNGPNGNKASFHDHCASVNAKLWSALAQIDVLIPIIPPDKINNEHTTIESATTHFLWTYEKPATQEYQGGNYLSIAEHEAARISNAYEIAEIIESMGG